MSIGPPNPCGLSVPSVSDQPALQTCRPTETLLLGIYNLEVVDERGQPRVVSFRMPTLVKQSVYHMVSSGHIAARVAVIRFISSLM